jgi:hypothetical protein
VSPAARRPAVALGRQRRPESAPDRGARRNPSLDQVPPANLERHVADRLEPSPRRGSRAERPRDRDQLRAGARDRLSDLRWQLGLPERRRQLARAPDRGDDRVALGGIESERVEQLPELPRRHVERGERECERAALAVIGEQRQRSAAESVVCQAKARMDRHVEPQPAHVPERGQRIGFARQQPQLGAHSRTAHGGQRPARHRLVGQLSRVRLDRERQPARVTDEAKQPGGIVEEAGVMEHPQAAGLKVLARPWCGSDRSGLRPAD